MPGIITDGLLSPEIFEWSGEKNAKKLNDELIRIGSETLLADIPMSHLSGHTRLKRIVRGTKVGPSEGWINWYLFEAEVIIINIPLKMQSIYKRMTKSTGDVLWGGLQGGHTFWARDPIDRALATDLLLPWAFRHEFGHSIDKLLQFSNRFAGHPMFGGWVCYRSQKDFKHDLVQDILTGMGSRIDLRAHEVPPKLQAVADEIERHLFDPDGFHRRSTQRAILAKIEEIEEAVFRHDFKWVLAVLEGGFKQPWLQSNPHLMSVIDGRIYSWSNLYSQWCSFSLDSYTRRVSNYQFCSPVEWFAEYYSARYGQHSGPAMHASLHRHSPDVIEEMDRIFQSHTDPRTGALITVHISNRPRPAGEFVHPLSPREMKLANEGVATVDSVREDGSYRLGRNACDACKVESSAVRAIGILWDLILPRLCADCSHRFGSQPLSQRQLSALCVSCTESRNEELVTRLEKLNATIRKKPIIVCPDSRDKRHTRALFVEDCCERLVPSSWYRNNHVKDQTISALCSGLPGHTRPRRGALPGSSRPPRVGGSRA